MICGFLNIESNTIFGIKKEMTRNFTNLIKINEYAWNYIVIDNKYYLIDIASAIDKCENVPFRSDDVYFFGINPEFSIRHRFPNDKKWQLLSKPITEDKFKSQAILYGGFFEYFKSFSPDIQTLRFEDNMKIKLTVKDPNIQKWYFDDLLLKEGYPVPVFGYQREGSIKNGTCEYNVELLRTGNTYGYIYIYIYRGIGTIREGCGNIIYEAFYNK